MHTDQKTIPESQQAINHVNSSAEIGIDTSKSMETLEVQSRLVRTNASIQGATFHWLVTLVLAIFGEEPASSVLNTAIIFEAEP